MGLIYTIYLLFEKALDQITEGASNFLAILNKPIAELVTTYLNIFPENSVMDNIFEWVISNILSATYFSEMPLFVFIMGGGFLVWTAFNIFRFVKNFYV